MTSLYRKYRPHNFSEVIGQEVVVRSLENSIKNERITHAFIFNGSRGTGKTSIAKIFARAINCENKENILCGECDACQAMKDTDNVVDIIELDGASNNGVDEIRKIIENSKYLPINLKYKVYIIDEVHMLSKGAFNSLLKTLEEPPKHVKFMLATTEINRVPSTILSRCQRFDFSLIENDVLIKRFEKILSEEKIKSTTESLELIAKLANGSVRDGLSLLEQVITYKGEVDLEAVEKSLKITTNENYDLLYQKMMDHDIKKVLDLFASFRQKGLDEYNFLVTFQYFLRDKLLESFEIEGAYKLQIVNLIKELSQIIYNLRFVNNTHIFVESSLISLTAQKAESQNIQPEIMEKTKVVFEEPEFMKKVQEVSNKNDNKENLELLKNTIETEKLTEESIAGSSEDVIIEDVVEIECDEEDGKVFEGLLKSESVKIPIMDVLKTATKMDRQIYIDKFSELNKKLSEEKKRGLAKFFTLSSVRAASENGVVVAIDEHYFKEYNERIEEIGENINLVCSKKVSLHLVEIDKWQQIREDYKKRMMMPEKKEDDYIKKAEKLFGKENINIT